MEHEQHSEADSWETEVSGIVVVVEPWVTDEPVDHPVTVPDDKSGRSAPD